MANCIQTRAAPGGRKAGTGVGDCWESFLVTYRYPNDVRVEFRGAQFRKGNREMCIRGYVGAAEAPGAGTKRSSRMGGWMGI